MLRATATAAVTGPAYPPSVIRIVPIVTLAACVLAQGSVALAGERDHPRRGGAAAASLRITYSTRDFTLHYTLHCGHASGTLPRAATACEAIARNPSMVHGEPPEPSATFIRSCPAPRETVHVAGTYQGARAAADGSDTCGSWKVLHDWQPFLPSREYLDEVRVNKGAGPVRLGEPRATVRSLLGTPSETISGADVYVSQTTAIGVDTRSSHVLGLVREMFAVGYGRHGAVRTIISNWLAATRPSSPPLSHPRSVLCAGRHSIASRTLDAHSPTTILWPSDGYSTVIVTSASTAACRLARATEQSVVNGI